MSWVRCVGEAECFAKINFCPRNTPKGREKKKFLFASFFVFAGRDINYSGFTIEETGITPVPPNTIPRLVVANH